MITVQHYSPGWSSDPKPGDFVLTHGNALANRAIRFGQSLRFRGERRVYAHWNHAALVVNKGIIIEALTTGVQVNKLSKYDHIGHTVVSVNASPEDVEQMLNFAWAQVGKPYGFLTIAGLVIWTLFGGRFDVSLDGTSICSGLVARSLERAGFIFDREPNVMTPADLAEFFQVSPRVLTLPHDS